MIYRSNLTAPDLQTCFRRLLQDEVNASLRVLPGSVILLHDAIYDSGKEAARYLISDGWKHKVYRTPHGVVLFYHDPFVPPEHMPDPNIQAVAL